MKPINLKKSDNNTRVVFSNAWETQGGPNFTGFVEIMLRDGHYFANVINEENTPIEKTYGPYENLVSALDDEDSAAGIVGPGTVEIRCTEMTLVSILNHLRVYIPEVDCEDDGDPSWEIKVNGERVHVSAEGFKIDGKIYRGKSATHRR